MGSTGMKKKNVSGWWDLILLPICVTKCDYSVKTCTCTFLQVGDESVSHLFRCESYCCENELIYTSDDGADKCDDAWPLSMWIIHRCKCANSWLLKVQGEISILEVLGLSWCCVFFTYIWDGYGEETDCWFSLSTLIFFFWPYNFAYSIALMLYSSPLHVFISPSSNIFCHSKNHI